MGGIDVVDKRGLPWMNVGQACTCDGCRPGEGVPACVLCNCLCSWRNVSLSIGHIQAKTAQRSAAHHSGLPWRPKGSHRIMIKQAARIWDVEWCIAKRVCRVTHEVPGPSLATGGPITGRGMAGLDPRREKLLGKGDEFAVEVCDLQGWRYRQMARVCGRVSAVPYDCP
jgi:hypothetical protein